MEAPTNIEFMTDEKFLKKLGERIESLRKSKDLTQENLAKKLKSHRASVIRMEQGTVSSSITTLRQVAKVLNVSLAELISVD